MQKKKDKILVSTLRENPRNPRTISKAKFLKLCTSIKEFPRMMELRPLVVDEKNTVLGGNMRLKAIIELGMKEIPSSWVVKASDLSKAERRRFIIADNIPFGDWSDELADDFELDELQVWGLDEKDLNISEDESNKGGSDNTDGLNKCICPTCGKPH